MTKKVYKVAICDDEMIFINHLEDCLQKVTKELDISCEISTFILPEKLKNEVA